MSNADFVQALLKDAKSQWDILVNLQIGLAATKIAQFIILSNIAKDNPGLYAKITGELTSFSKNLEDNGVHDTEIISHFQKLCDADPEYLSVMQEQLQKILASSLPLDGDLSQ
jgi:hypothetical protein